MPRVWISPAQTYNETQDNGAITPRSMTTPVTINGGVPILEGSVVAPHGTHTGTITINGGLGVAKVTIGGHRVAIESSTASCGDGIAPEDEGPLTLSTTVTIG